MCGVRQANVGYCRDDVSGYAKAVARLVCRDLVDHDAKKRRHRQRFAASSRAEKLRDRVDLAVINDASGDSLIPFVLENIEPGSRLITDDWTGFSGIEAAGYARTVHKQSAAKSENETLPHVHLVISLLKRWLLGTHQGTVEAKHLQAYLNEYVFRFNRRTSSQRGLLFYRLLENAMMVSPVTYREIVDKNLP